MELYARSFTFSCSSSRDDTLPCLKIAAKRYTTATSTLSMKGLTVIFAHCIGSHKEQWEPTLQGLFAAQHSKSESLRIREAWCFDWQNHGDSAVQNMEPLRNRPHGVSVFEWSSAIIEFIRSPHMTGHRIVLVGHSAGAAAVTLTTKGFPISGLPLTGLVLVEPTMVTRELWNAHLDDRMASMDLSVAATSMRRDKWRTREDAHNYFSRRNPWKAWDPRVVRLYTQYGLIEQPDGQVGLKCDRKQEAVSYPDTEPHFKATVQLGRVCHTLPVHIIWAERSNIVPEFMQESLCDVSEGRIAASVTKIKSAGHMVVQEQPDLLAKSIAEALSTMNCMPPAERSKL
ncbi:Alpha/beta hydrolase fold-1 [Cyathus striatus]|nr:Alpha/beta hydrolase fold-1 [Cyathus striatus]